MILDQRLGWKKRVWGAQGTECGLPPEENDKDYAEKLKPCKLKWTRSQHEFKFSPHLLGVARWAGGGGGESPVRSGHWVPTTCNAPVKAKPLWIPTFWNKLRFWTDKQEGAPTAESCRGHSELTGMVGLSRSCGGAGQGCDVGVQALQTCRPVTAYNALDPLTFDNAYWVLWDWSMF